MSEIVIKLAGSTEVSYSRDGNEFDGKPKLMKMPSGSTNQRFVILPSL